MNTWLSYSPDDLLMFTPEVYFRLFERYNAWLWPGQVLAVMLALLMIVGLWRGGAAYGQRIAFALASAWLLIAVVFFYGFYAEIFLAAPYFAVGCGVQAAWLLLAAWFGWGRAQVAAPGARRLSLALMVYAAAVHPLLGWLAGRDWRGIELLLLTPDATAVGTVAWLLLGRRNGLLMLLPLLWLAVSGITHWVMGYAVGLVAPALTLAAIGARVWYSRRR